MPRDGWSWAEFGRTRHLVGLGWLVGVLCNSVGIVDIVDI